MRLFIFASSLAIAVSACGQAQDKPSGTGTMPILSAMNTIETCFQDHASIEARRDECVGQYAQACMNLTEGGETTAGMVGCLGQEYEAWDARLNTSYARLQEGLSDAGITALRDAQRAWIASRDADCQFARFQYEGGSLASVIGSNCMLERAADRALTLDQWIVDFTTP
jgi:uncharacterized protein YecT (DUF1311 family)